MADDRGGREPVPNEAPGQGGRKTSMTVAEAQAQDAVSAAAVHRLAHDRYESEGHDGDWGDVGGERKASRLDEARRDLEAAQQPDQYLSLREAVMEACEKMAGPLGRARCRAEDAEEVDQIRDLGLVRDGMTILRAALAKGAR